MSVVLEHASIVGRRTPPVTVTIDRGRLRLFAKATGQTDPVYVDVDAARAAGHPDLLVPPTYLFGIEFERPDPFDWYRQLGFDMEAMLHGSQSFEYRTAVHAGDEVTAESVITDVHVKRGGALTLIERTSTICRGDRAVARLLGVAVVRGAA
jgi:acyl dehydratase